MLKKRVMIISIFILYLFTINSIAYDLTEFDFTIGNDGVFARYTMDSGLSQSSIEDVLLDSKGRLWIATQDGLNRFAGDYFIHYKYSSNNDNTLSDNTTQNVFEDSTGAIWVGTMQGGINKYIDENDHFNRYTLALGNEDTAYEIHDIIEDSHNHLWIATEKGMFIYDAENDKFELVKGIGDYFISDLIIDGNNNIWAISDDLLIRVDENHNLTKISNDSESDKFLRGISFDDKTLLIQKGNNNILTFNIETYEFDECLLLKEAGIDGKISTFYRDSNDYLWVGMYNTGLYKIDIEAKQYKYFFNNPYELYSLSHDNISLIYEDGRGQIWVGTSLNGVSVYSSEQQKFHVVRNNMNIENSILDNTLRGFYYFESREEFWVATSKGMNLWDEGIRGYKHYLFEDGNYPESQSGMVRGMFSDGKDIYGFSWSGISVYVPEEDKFIEYLGNDSIDLLPSRFTVIYIDDDGYEYIGAREGLFIKYPGSDKYEFFTTEKGLTTNFISHIFEDKSGNTFIAGSRGLDVFNKENKEITTIEFGTEFEKSFLGIHVFNLTETNDGYWVGTRGGGIFLLSKDFKEYKNYTESDGLPNGTAYSILESDDGILYISSNKGIYSFNPKTLEVYAFNQKDGVQSLEFNNNAYWQSDDGIIFMGGPSGFNYFNPNKLNLNSKKSETIFSKIIFEGIDKNYAYGTDFEIPFVKYENRNINFEYYSTDFTMKAATKYKYFLEGYDKEWSEETYSKRVTYTNLPSGEYTFKVIASDIDNGWNSQELEYKFVIDKAIWETPQAFFGYFLIILGFVYFAYYMSNWKNRKIKAENKRLETLVAIRTEELEKLATIDTLTNLYNRRKMDEFLESEIARSNRYNHELYALICDIDFFKKINDNFGHIAGDEALINVASTMQNSIRETDFLARWGGEEFLILAVESSEDEIYSMAERVRKNIESITLESIEKITISIGVTKFQKNESVDKFINRADQNLYEAKETGRNKVIMK